MVEHYFDIETTGLNFEHDKIITIQIQELTERTGEPIGEIDILKEWESSEKEIIEKVIPLLTCGNPFAFIIVGRNLLFDFTFLNKRAEKYGLNGLDLRWLYSRAFIDLKPILVVMNDGRFRGYDKLLKKTEVTNEQIGQFYEQENYEEIVKYIEEEAKIFTDAYQKLRKKMPSFAKHL